VVPLEREIIEKERFPCRNGKSTNSRLSVESKQKAMIKCTREIKEGEEIYVGYGFKYWEFCYNY
jgi:hypothetical protein